MAGLIAHSTLFVEQLAKLCERVAIGALFAMTGLVTLQIIGREVFRLGLPSVEELARWSGLCLVYFTVPLLFLSGKHVSVDMFLSRIKGPARKAIDLLMESLTIAFALFFLIGGWLFMQRAGRFTTPALGMPNLLFYAPVLFGMALSLLAGLVRLHRVAVAPGREASAEELQP